MAVLVDPPPLGRRSASLPAHSTRARGFFVSSVLCLPAWATTVTSVSEGEVMFGPPGEKHPGGGECNIHGC